MTEAHEILAAGQDTARMIRETASKWSAGYREYGEAIADDVEALTTGVASASESDDAVSTITIFRAKPLLVALKEEHDTIQEAVDAGVPWTLFLLVKLME